MRRSLFAAGLAVCLLARGSFADPASEAFDGLIAEIDRIVAETDPSDPGLARRVKFLERLRKAISKRSISLATDADLAAKLLKLVEKGGDDLVDLSDDVQGALDFIRDEVERMVESLEYRVVDLPDSKERTKAADKIATMRALFDGTAGRAPAAQAATYKQIILLRRSALKLVKKAEANAFEE